MNKPPIAESDENFEHSLFGHVIHMAQHNVTREEFMQLRQEMNQGFEKAGQETSELRAEMQRGFERVDQETSKLRAEMQQGFEKVDQKIDRETDKLRTEMSGLRDEISGVRRESNIRFYISVGIMLTGFLTVLALGSAQTFLRGAVHSAQYATENPAYAAAESR